MRRMAVQFRREFAAYFMTPMGFVIMTILLVLTGLIFSAALVQFRLASFQLVVPTLTFVNFIIAPVVSMRLIAEERRTGTLESLMTAPVREWEIVVAKYLGAVCFYMVLYLPTLFYLGLLFYYTPPPRIENGPEIPQAASAYLALFLSGAAFISVGLLVSTLTRHQIVAAVLGVIGCIILWVLGIAGAWVGGVPGAMLEYLGTFDHLDAFSRGVLSTRDGIYFLSLIGLFLLLSQISLTRRKPVSTIIACALALLIFAEVNYLGNRHYLRVDITASRRYSLSPKSIQVVRSLDVPIRVSTTFTMRDDSMWQTLELLGEYAQYSDNFLFREGDNINPPEDPEAFQAHAMRYKFYNYEEAVDHIVLDYRGGERTRVVRIRDLLEQTPTGTAYLGEEKIAGAILDLTEARKTGVYFTVGHGERSTRTPGIIGLSKWRRYLEVENYRVEDIDLAQEEIPEDCDLIVVVGPSDPFRPEEEDALREYLSGGGRALLLLGSGSRPGLKGLLDEWGVDLRDDLILTRGPLGPTRQVLVSEFNPHPITDPLEGKRIALDYARSVDTVHPLPEGIQGEVLFESHEEAWAETIREGRIEGPLPLAVSLQKEDARLIVVGSVALGENGGPFVGKVGIDDGANNDMALNVVGHLTERQRMVGIAPKKVDIRRVEIDEGDETVIYLLCLGLLPGLCLLAGLAIWWSRRG